MYTLAGTFIGSLAVLALTHGTENVSLHDKPAPKPTIVLVHGAFADASGWSRVIKILAHDGYNVVAAQNAMSSYAGDVETTKRIIDAQKGPVVVVGHSYGGAVITGAAAGNSNVISLVYIAAFAPEANETVGALLEKYPSSLGAALRPDAAGFLYIDRAQFHDIFASDLAVEETDVMAVSQKPLAGPIFNQSVPKPAWKSIPSWYMVARGDKAINPDLERFFAKRMGAKTTELSSSHVPFMSQPAAVARMIEEAAGATTKTAATR